MSAEAPQLDPVVRPAAEQDEQLQDLFERFAHPLERFCLRELGNHEEAEDAVQTTFLNAFRAFRRGVRPDLEGPWLYAIAANVCRARRRSFFRRRRVECDDDLRALEDVVAAPAPIEPEALMGLGDALVAMPASQRIAILLREWQGLSYDEIAHELGITHAAVETLIFRARHSLAKGLEEEQPRRRRLVGGLNIGSLASALKGLLGGAGAAKVVAAGAVVVVASVAAVSPRHHGAPASAALRMIEVAAAQPARAAVSTAAREVAGPVGAHPHGARFVAPTSAAASLAQTSIPQAVVHSLLATAAPQARAVPGHPHEAGRSARGSGGSAAPHPTQARASLVTDVEAAAQPVVADQPARATDVVTGTVDAAADGLQSGIGSAEATAEATASDAADAAAAPASVSAATTGAAGLATPATGAVATPATTAVATTAATTIGSGS